MDKVGALLGLLILGVLAALFSVSPSYAIDVIFFIAFYAIAALSLNLEYGYTGLNNFGQVAFIAVGAYTAGVLSSAFHLPFVYCLLAAALAGGLLGAFVAVPTVKLREDYLGMATIIIGEMIRILLRNTPTESVWGGVFGLRGINPVFAYIKDPLARQGAFVLLTLSLLALTYWLVDKWGNSPLGRVLKSIRDDELASKSVGKFTYRYKLITMFVGSALAGVAGALYAFYFLYLNPDVFMPLITFMIWIMVIMGGVANNYGVVVGSAIVILINRLTQIAKDYINLPIEPNYFQAMMVGILIIVFLMFRPQGLVVEKVVRTPAWSVLKRAEEEGRAKPPGGEEQ
ncbi:branched-chain amino acid ABC transporter permease [Ignicoccus hospitalis]|uniref:Inner-membrane translocator n=1 Tax=Ignicoccus hospitalis (strain KIN4/I / DSM 18386 / JCM 14125) TaxID=453591 RepID=A8AAG0_IGNH4|nr:branched-chain amino acid ABC transporter permease [Ignicoccus hospitalis]ABU81912.1 inner-membrane translocator [Ignicoccus hospitalis KIN4/I]HIH89930.1 branched-chain amino acid ABC transporter permease [Desulfurococcaceae archaeon]